MGNETGQTAGLHGQSDDLAHVEVNGQGVFRDESTDKRLVITSPQGGRIVATLSYGDGWGVSFSIPDGWDVKAEQNSAWPKAEWEMQ